MTPFEVRAGGWNRHLVDSGRRQHVMGADPAPDHMGAGPSAARLTPRSLENAEATRAHHTRHVVWVGQPVQLHALASRRKDLDIWVEVGLLHLVQRDRIELGLAYGTLTPRSLR